MSAIFGEILTFGQASGPDLQLRVTGDEYYASYETPDGFTACYDSDRGQFCYAVLTGGGLFVSSGVPVMEAPPAGLARHLTESPTVRHRRFESRRLRAQPLRSTEPHDIAFTFGPSQGLLAGRRLSSGAVRGLTILVEFQDVRSTVTQADVNDLLNAANYTRNGNFCSAREYFRIVSSGRLDYSNDVVGPFRLSQDRSFYIDNLLVKEALDLAVAAGVDLSRYDSRGDGILDALNVLYAGQTQYQGELWPHNFTIALRYGAISTNLYLLTSMGRTAADLSIGTFCHENGHLLCRFPDMYDYGAVNREGDGVKSAGIGSYCLMGSGNHLNDGLTPSPVCAYLRDLAGWCDQEIVLNSAAQFEAVHGDYRTVMKYRTSAPNEYFLVENRAKLGLDTHLPASGLAVYHCDILGSNEFQDGGAKHYQCALLQADGHTDLERNVNQGDGSDFFGGVHGIALSGSTAPHARLWSGADSGLVLADIEVPDASIGFRTGAVAPEPTLRVESTTVVPIPDNNPTGIASTIAVAESGKVIAVRVRIDITHAYIGDLVVELSAPGGLKTVRLHNRTGSGADNLSATYEGIAVADFRALEVHGDWMLIVRDLAGRDEGKLNRWSLEFALDGAASVARGEATPNLAIPDNNSAGVSSGIAIAPAGTVGALKVNIDIQHTYIGDLRIELISPAGRAVVLHGRLGAGDDNLVITYDSTAALSSLAALHGQSMSGIWTLRVADLAAIDAGTLKKWSLEITPAP